MISLEKILNSKKLFLISGPCVIENKNATLEIASRIKDITTELDIPFIFKASYQKANRSRIDSFTGPGIEDGLNTLKTIKDKLSIPITSDIHSVEDIKKASNILDIIQIPAFLCRQTDLLIAAGKTNKYVNVKKGPFLSGEACQFIINKIKSTKNNKIIITERGNSFGYENLIVDMRNIPILQRNNCPVVIDVTHSNQKPNQKEGISGGTPEFIDTIACAGVAAGANGIFLETHPSPKDALSDGSNMLKTSQLKKLLSKLIAINKTLQH